jgi:hypothetical protein
MALQTGHGDKVDNRRDHVLSGSYVCGHPPKAAQHTHTPKRRNKKRNVAALEAAKPSVGRTTLSLFCDSLN